MQGGQETGALRCTTTMLADKIATKKKVRFKTDALAVLLLGT